MSLFFLIHVTNVRLMRKIEWNWMSNGCWRVLTQELLLWAE